MTDFTPTTEENIRFILGATGANSTLLTALEIDHAMVLYPTNWRLAAAFIAEALAARAINDPTSFALAGTLNVSWADRAKTWKSIANSLRDEAAYDISQGLEPMGLQSSLLKREEVGHDPLEYRVRDWGVYKRGLN